MTRFTDLLVCHSFRLFGIKPQKIDHPLTFLEKKCESPCLNFLECISPSYTASATWAMLFYFRAHDRHEAEADARIGLMLEGHKKRDYFLYNKTFTRHHYLGYF